MQNIFLYFPQSQSYFEVGQKLLDANKQETDISVKKIEVDDKNIVRITMSNNDTYMYGNVPFSSKL